MNESPVSEIGVTFDFGQTLYEIDPALLARRLAERGHVVSPERFDKALGPAWRAYDDFVQKGLGGHPWEVFMARVLEGAGVDVKATEALAAWLFAEQPTLNLWRRPIESMIEIARELRAARVPIAILSNSEGRLAEFVEDLGLTPLFDIVVDSGRLGMEKPDPRIFAHAAERIGLPLERLLHIGDSHAADVMGALAAGMRAIWFRGTSDAPYRDVPDAPILDASRAGVCTNALEVRAALAAFGVRIAANPA